MTNKSLPTSCGNDCHVSLPTQLSVYIYICTSHSNICFESRYLAYSKCLEVVCDILVKLSIKTHTFSFLASDWWRTPIQFYSVRRSSDLEGRASLLFSACFWKGCIGLIGKKNSMVRFTERLKLFQLFRVECENRSCSPGCRSALNALLWNVIYNDWRIVKAIDIEARTDVPWDLDDYEPISRPAQ